MCVELARLSEALELVGEIDDGQVLPATLLKRIDMVHSSITDHIDRDGAKCCNSNLPYTMLMKLSGQTNSLLSCVVYQKKVEIPLGTS